jgi:hypothetical protein
VTAKLGWLVQNYQINFITAFIVALKLKRDRSFQALPKHDLRVRKLFILNHSFFSGIRDTDINLNEVHAVPPGCVDPNAVWDGAIDKDAQPGSKRRLLYDLDTSTGSGTAEAAPHCPCSSSCNLVGTW